MPRSSCVCMLTKTIADYSNHGAEKHNVGTAVMLRLTERDSFN